VTETKPSVDEKKLAALAQTAPPSAPEKPAPAEEKPVDLSQAEEKLSSLLGKKK
jgi:hypothetical protein